MRTLAIGDIHGCSRAFDALLELLAPKRTDTLVTLGDYVDRGPNTREVLDRLLELDSRVRLIPLRGNHEVMMIEARYNPRAFHGWLAVGGEAVMQSYGSLEAVPQTHWDFIENRCLSLWETDTHFFVHAGVYDDLPLYEQPDLMLYWERFRHPRPHMSGKIMVCGHTSQKNGIPRNVGHAICLDTWACGGGWLSGLEIETGRIWQTNQHGQRRELWLDELLEE